MKRLLLTTLVTLSLSTTTLSAQEYILGDLVIAHPYTRTTPPMAPVGGGFLSITNNGKEDARLVGGKAEFAEIVEIHEMSMQDSVMKMRQLEDGLVIPASGTVELKPGGYHLMFIKLSEQMKENEQHKVTLSFAQAGDIDIEFEVKDISKMMEKSAGKVMNHSQHSNMKHNTDAERAKKTIDHSQHNEMKHDMGTKKSEGNSE